MTPPRRPLPLAAYLGLTGWMPRLVEALALRAHSRMSAPPERRAERLGQASAARPPGRLVWLHAASVGEVTSIADLMGELARTPDLGLLVTTTTATGAAAARRLMPDGTIHQYLPADTPGAASAFLDHWQPDLAGFVESDLWPRLLAACKARSTPLALINARHSATRRRLGRSFSALLAQFDLITCQNPQVQAEIAQLGVVPARFGPTGDLKSENAALAADPAELAALRAALGSRPLWAAVSTHAEDEPAVRAAHQEARSRHPDLLLLHAPRHPERSGKVAADWQAAGHVLSRRSLDPVPAEQSSVFVIDSLGLTGLIYRLAPVVFLGGSFGDQGGHNPYEATRLGALVLHGPKVANAAAAYAQLGREGTARSVTDAHDLGTAVAGLAGPARSGPAVQPAQAAGLAAAIAQSLLALRADPPEKPV